MDHVKETCASKMDCRVCRCPGRLSEGAGVTVVFCMFLLSRYYFPFFLRLLLFLIICRDHGLTTSWWTLIC